MEAIMEAFSQTSPYSFFPLLTLCSLFLPPHLTNHKFFQTFTIEFASGTLIFSPIALSLLYPFLSFLKPALLMILNIKSC